MLHSVNPCVKIYQRAGFMLRDEPSLQLNIVLKSNYDVDKRFNLPTTDEIAVLMIENDSTNIIKNRDIVLRKKSTTIEEDANNPDFNKLIL